MYKFLTVLIMMCMAFATSRADSGDVQHTITFRITADHVPEGDAVYLAGNHPALGGWAVKGLKLEPQADGSWAKAVSFAAGTELEFKVHRGSWAREALGEDGSVPGNYRHKVLVDWTIQIDVPAWKDEVQSAGEGITGTVNYHEQFRGKGLVSRDLLVWLPPSYKEETEKRYPVLYMHDAQQVFDPSTSTHGIDWGVDETITRLVGAGAMKEVIVASTTSTRDRSREYGQDDELGKAYRRFLVEELKPFVDREYRTLPGREHTAVMGSSMGGIASFLMVYEYPEVFSMAGCLSSAFWLDFEDLKESAWPTLPVKIYMDNGGIGLERVLQPGNDWMLEVLQNKGFVLGENLVWAMDIKAEHNEAAWAKRVHVPLKWFFGSGTQDWIAELPPPPPPMFADRDRKPPVKRTLPDQKLLGREVEYNSWDPDMEKLAAVWDHVMDQREHHPMLAELEGVSGRVGLHYRDNWDKEAFFAGYLVEQEPLALPDEWVLKELVGREYLVFDHTGPYEDLPETFNYIFNWYLPRHKLEQDGPCLEEAETAGGAMQLLVPVKSKT